MAGEPCIREGCTRPSIARGRCRSCYNLAHRRGEFAVPTYARRTSGFVCPPEHGHGATQYCYHSHRCSCADCYTAQSARMRQRHRDRFYGRIEPALLPARGTHRRIQALHARGWSFSELSRRLGLTRTSLRGVLFNASVKRTTHERICALFSELAMEAPPMSTPVERRSASLARRHASVQGWPPPLAWDDIDFDDEPARADVDSAVDEVLVERAAHGEGVALTVAERRAAVRLLNGIGYSDREIAERLRVASRTIVRDRVFEQIEAAQNAARERIVA